MQAACHVERADSDWHNSLKPNGLGSARLAAPPTGVRARNVPARREANQKIKRPKELRPVGTNLPRENKAHVHSGRDSAEENACTA